VLAAELVRAGRVRVESAHACGACGAAPCVACGAEPWQPRGRRRAHAPGSPQPDRALPPCAAMLLKHLAHQAAAAAAVAPASSPGPAARCPLTRRARLPGVLHRGGLVPQPGPAAAVHQQHAPGLQQGRALVQQPRHVGHHADQHGRLDVACGRAEAPKLAGGRLGLPAWLALVAGCSWHSGRPCALPQSLAQGGCTQKAGTVRVPSTPT
jgi:hypothetical protein